MNDSIINPKKFLTEYYQQMLSHPDGPEAFLKGSEFKKDHEYWAISMVLIGVNKLLGTPWWIKRSNQDPPDGVSTTYKIDKGTRSLVEEPVPLEVVFIPKYIKNQNWDNNLSDEENIFNFLNEKKFKNKAYESGTHLIIYFNLTLKDFLFQKLYELIKKAAPNLREIWAIAALDPLLKECLIAQLYPDMRSITINEENYFLNKKP